MIYILVLIAVVAAVRWDTPRQRDRFPFWEDDRWRRPRRQRHGLRRPSDRLHRAGRDPRPHPSHAIIAWSRRLPEL